MTAFCLTIVIGFNFACLNSINYKSFLKLLKKNYDCSIMHMDKHVEVMF